MDIKKHSKVIRELNNKGMSAEEIAFQLDVSKEEIENILEDREKQKKDFIDSILKSYVSADKPVRAKESVKKSRLDIMRENYKSIYTSIPFSIEKAKKNDAFVKEKINNIRQLYETLRTKMETKDRAGLFYQIYKEIKQVADFEVLKDDCLFLSDMMQDEMITSLQGYIFGRKRGIVYIDEASKIINRRKGYALAKSAAKASSLEEMNELISSFIKPSEKKDFYYDGVKARVYRKRDELKKAENLRKMKYGMSDETRDVLLKIANGTITREDFESYIELETKRKMETVSDFGMSKRIDSYRQHIISSLKLLLTERGDTFRITDVDSFKKVYASFLDTSNQGENGYINLIVGNNLKNKEFEKAKEFCKRYTGNRIYRGEAYTLYRTVRGIEKRIALEELGEVILSKLKNRVSYEDDEHFIEELNKRMQEGEIGLSTIPLGYNELESRKISLFDIWYDEKEKYKKGVSK